MPILEDEREVERPADQHTITRRYTEKAVEFIRAHRDRPFFLYLAHSMMHIPLFASKEFDGRSRAGLYGDAIEEVDWSVGQIVDTLKELGLDRADAPRLHLRQRAVARASTTHGGSAGLLRGGKGDTFEGGHARAHRHLGPGARRPARRPASMGSTLDLLPTFCALAGVDTAERPGARRVRPRRRCSAGEGREPSRADDLLPGRGDLRGPGGPVQGPLRHPVRLRRRTARSPHDPPLLYNLEEDPSERFDVAVRHPDVVRRIQAAVAAHRKTVEPVENQLDIPLPAAAQAADRFAIPATDEGLPGAGPIRRYEWFQNLWRERRSGWAARVDQDRNAVVFLGDSITQGWGGGLGAAFPGMKVANRGISGDTTRGVLLRLKDDVLALDPTAVVLLIGTNDLEEGATPEVVAGNLKHILAGLEQHDPGMPIVLCQVFPSAATKKRPVEQIQAVNALYRAAVKDDPRVTYLETWPLFAGPEGDATAALFPDLLHPNEAGYARWAAALRPILATLGFTETEPDPFRPEEGFESLFNGRDLTGWGYRPTSEADIESARRWQASDPEAAAWPFVTERVEFDGRTVTPDGRFAAINGRLVVTTPPEYRKIQQLWTTREFPRDFVLKLEFRATPNTDSGIYLRGPQLQCRDYLLAGPYEDLKLYSPQGWNEIVVTVRDGVARATCNGELLEAALRVPGTGPIGLEGDRGQMEYRRIRIKTLSR